ncbi:MAG: DEAD/DEAH box helicase [Crocinitomicaceae bacterium]|nr:DEAD/DEAH box helicase [Crocinitomicaceae bacterium]MDG1776946.1 DEAD/DEAH box helicase [Crocinitomicaceae bacterium]
MSFSDLGLTPALLNILTNQEYENPYPIQKKVIPSIIEKQDLLGIARTGSGKTASFVLPILTNLQTSEISQNRHVNVLVLVPTRELATQVRDVFHIFSVGLPKPIKTMAVFGGASINPQMKAMRGVNVLVATPGRLIELVESNAVHLSAIETLVLDEADKMLNLGFKDEMNAIFKLLPQKRQNLLFSATLSENIEAITQFLLKNPVVVKIETGETNLDLIDQLAYDISEEKKGPLLRYLIKSQDMQQVLVFASSIFKVDNIAEKLTKNGIQAVATHSKKSSKARRDALHNFKAGKLRVLVTTDLLSRGIDIEFLPYVINYELPRSPKDYVHRIGRTGRAEAPGKALTLVTPQDQHHFKIIQKKMKRQVNRQDGNVINLQGY